MPLAGPGAIECCQRYGTVLDEVTIERVLPVEECLAEVGRIFELDRRLARTVATADGRDQFLLVPRSSLFARVAKPDREGRSATVAMTA